MKVPLIIMIIFTEPDATIYPPGFTSKSCPGLEAKTGADMVLSQIPIPPTVNLDLHIKSRSLFVQIKIDNDNLSFDAIRRFIARVQACKIPRSQAILLRVGKQWKDGDLFRIRGKKAYGETKWRDYRRMVMANGFRGITIFPECLTSIDDLPDWIEDYGSVIDKVTTEGQRDIYPPSPEFIPEDIWQSVEEISDWRKFLVSGLDNFASAKANAVFKYAREHFDGSPYGFYHILCLMTDEKDGKPIHKIPLWGNKSRDDFREQLGIQDGWNL